MKLNAETLDVLKSFSSINSSIYFRKGNILSTISSSKTIMAKATLNQNFKKDFAIFDLPRFLSVINFLKDPDLVFDSSWVTLSSENQKIKYTYADPNSIVTPPEKDINFPTADVKFRLSDVILKKISNATSVLSVSEVAFCGDGSKISLQVFDSKNSTGDLYSVDIGETDKIFKIVFKADYLKVMPMDYDVSISAKGISYFKGIDIVEYWIAVEAGSSSFGEQ
jgi:hypothetical protein